MTPDHAHHGEQDHVTKDHARRVVPDHVDSASVTGDHADKSHVTPNHAHRDEPSNVALCHPSDGVPNQMATDLTQHKGPGHVTTEDAATDHAHKGHVTKDHVIPGPVTSSSQKPHLSARVVDATSAVVIQ